MKQKQLEIVVAATPNGEIGYKNTIPWHLQGDLSRFKRLTMDQVVVMGLRTYESLPKALVGRSVIVLTRFAEGVRKALSWAGDRNEQILICTGLTEAMYSANRLAGERVIVAGGAALYQEALHQFKPVVHLTTVYKPPVSPYYDTKIENFDLRNYLLQGKPEVVYETNPKTGVLEVSHTYCRYLHKDINGVVHFDAWNQPPLPNIFPGKSS